jgi:hypothetical protein
VSSPTVNRASLAQSQSSKYWANQADTEVFPLAPFAQRRLLIFTFFRGDLRTSLTLVVGEDDTLKPSDQCEHQSRDQCEHETKK